MCLFCKLIDGTEPGYLVYETGDVCVFLDKYPIQKGHVLVMPKEHISELRELDLNTLHELMSVAKRMAATLEDTLHTDGITIGSVKVGC